MLSIRWKDTNLGGVPDYKGKKVAVWLGGNEFELYATSPNTTWIRRKTWRLSRSRST